MNIDPSLVYGPVGALVCLMVATWWLSNQLKAERLGREADRRTAETTRAADALKYESKLDEARLTTEAMARSAIDALKQAGVGK